MWVDLVGTLVPLSATIIIGVSLWHYLGISQDFPSVFHKDVISIMARHQLTLVLLIILSTWPFGLALEIYPEEYVPIFLTTKALFILACTITALRLQSGLRRYLARPPAATYAEVAEQ